MSLAPGTRIGGYDIVALVGAGGMGEVYRARDARLQRDVAIKILPEVFAADPERLARFDREARTLAALNHRNIAQVYGAEGGALIMEFVEGDDLAAHLTARGALPVDDAIPIALQIAEALEYAHEQGIVHRDLKPANLKVKADGTVKVLDFGLAKALDTGTARAPFDTTNSPTITSPFAMSNLGVILGTAAYMAPEQAKGKPLDKRVDIWAFGCVLYEMLTATRAFPGEDVTDTLAAVVRAEPDWGALPAETPASIRTLLRRCLEKDRRERLPDIGAARLELKERYGERATAAVATRPVVPARTPILPWSIAVVSALAAIGAIAFAVKPAPTPETPLMKLMIVPPAPLVGAPALRIALSPDGRQLAFAAPDASGASAVWVRPLDSETARPLAGTDHASAPFWSADSRSIAFIANGKLHRIAASGGPAIALSTAINAPPGAWNSDDVIVFSGFRGPLARVSARSPGPPVAVTELTASIGEKIQILPSFLPDNRHFLFTAGMGGSHVAGIYIGSLDEKKTELLMATASNAIYASGYLLYLRDTTLMAQPFDAVTRKTSGEAVPIATDVQINTATGTGAFSVSRSGVLAYQTGPSSGTRVLWLDKTGKPVATLSDRTGFQDVRLSPDGLTASATLLNDRAQEADVWLFDLRSGQARRLTFGRQPSAAAVWSPDSQRLVYAGVRNNKRAHDLYERAAGGTGSEKLVFADETDKYPLGFTPDGKALLYEVPTGAATGHAWILPLDGSKPRPFNQTADSEVPVAISPDGRWAAFVGDDGARREVFVTSFPDASGRWQISTDGGENPQWSADGKQLFFSGPDAFYAADVNTGGAQFVAGSVHRWFDVRVPTATLGMRSSYAVARDGKRILINMWDPQAALSPITIVVNWPALLRR